MKLGAAEASVSHGGAAGTTNPIKTYSIDEVQGLVSAVIKELVPVLVTGTRENPTTWLATSRAGSMEYPLDLFKIVEMTLV